ncbi:hypothetical protein D3C71_1202620 [compost metagenome]
MGDQTHLLGLQGIDRGACQRQAVGSAHAEGCNHIGRYDRGHDAESGLAQCELRPAVCNDEVGTADQTKTAPHSSASDFSDQRLGQRIHGGEHVRDGARPLALLRLRSGQGFLHPRDVASRAEVASCAAEHHDTRFGVLGGVSEGERDGSHYLGVERVLGFRAIQCDAADAVGKAGVNDQVHGGMVYKNTDNRTFNGICSPQAHAVQGKRRLWAS